MDMMEEVQHQLQHRRSNFSAYIQELIIRDLSSDINTPEPSDADALIRLTEKFHPTASEEIRKWAKSTPGLQQPFFIYKMLCALHSAIANKLASLTMELPKTD